MYCMMCIIHAGARYDSGYSCLPPGGFSDLFISLFCNCVKLSDVFVFQVQCQLHPSASRSKYFLLLSSPTVVLFLFLFLPSSSSSSCLPTQHLQFFSSFVYFRPSLFVFLSSVILLSLLPSFLCFPFSSIFFPSSFFLSFCLSFLPSFSFSSFSIVLLFSFLPAQLFLLFFLPLRSSSLSLPPLSHMRMQCFFVEC